MPPYITTDELFLLPYLLNWNCRPQSNLKRMGRRSNQIQCITPSRKKNRSSTGAGVILPGVGWDRNFLYIFFTPARDWDETRFLSVGVGWTGVKIQSRVILYFAPVYFYWFTPVLQSLVRIYKISGEGKKKIYILRLIPRIFPILHIWRKMSRRIDV